ncbi:MAG: DUF4317 family protein [Lachnospiraceae bacterium]|nr:DUF4317 family protein [Lachnospiraceae bacterium]
MKNSDRNELRRRFVKDNSISRLALCYVNSSREKVVVQNEVFLNLPEEDMFKYLDIAKKSLSGNIGDNLLELSYTGKQEEEENYRFLLGLRESGLKNEELIDVLFDKIIECYVYDGNYLITAIYDTYDVPVKTTDKMKLDESEESFSYIIVSICPVNQTKPGLGYLPLENRMGAREKDWVAGAPDAAFMFPSFSDRSTDIHKVVFYTKDTAQLHEEIIDSVLGCGTKRTATQCREVLKSAVSEIVGAENKEKARNTLLEIHDSLNSILEEYQAEAPEAEEERPLDRIILTAAVKDVIKDDAEVLKIVTTCEEEFDREPPSAELFVDKKALKKAEPERREKELVKEIETLKTQLKASDDGQGVSIIVPADRVDSIRFEEIDGSRFVLIPISDEEEPVIRGR